MTLSISALLQSVYPQSIINAVYISFILYSKPGTKSRQEAGTTAGCRGILIHQSGKNRKNNFFAIRRIAGDFTEIKGHL